VVAVLSTVGGAFSAVVDSKFGEVEVGVVLSAVTEAAGVVMSTRVRGAVPVMLSLVIEAADVVLEGVCGVETAVAGFDVGRDDGDRVGEKVSSTRVGTVVDGADEGANDVGTSVGLGDGAALGFAEAGTALLGGAEVDAVVVSAGVLGDRVTQGGSTQTHSDSWSRVHVPVISLPCWQLPGASHRPVEYLQSTVPGLSKKDVRA